MSRSTTSLRCFLAICVVWVALASANDAASDDAFFQDVVGTYVGQLWSDGVYQDATTTFYLGPDGVLLGTYSFTYNKQTYDGVLIKPQVSQDGDVTFIWEDAFGFGVLNITFSPDFQQFAGTWSTLDDGADAFPWFGKRVKQIP